MHRELRYEALDSGRLVHGFASQQVSRHWRSFELRVEVARGRESSRACSWVFNWKKAIGQDYLLSHLLKQHLKFYLDFH